MSSIKFNKIKDKIYHITLPNHEELAKALIRFQESYESPYDDIKGKVFTLGYLRSKGNRGTGLNTYEGGNYYGSDWGGYNFPSYILEPFVRGLFDPLTKYEEDIVNAFKYLPHPFYVIGTVEGQDTKVALEHEISHALFYNIPEYKTQVLEILSRYDLTGLFNWLREDGYREDVLHDEAHAYLGPDYDWLMDHHDKVKKFNANIPVQCHEELMAVREKFV